MKIIRWSGATRCRWQSEKSFLCFTRLSIFVLKNFRKCHGLFDQRCGGPHAQHKHYGNRVDGPFWLLHLAGQ